MMFKVHEPLEIEVYSVRTSLFGYGGNMTINLRFEQIKIVVIWEATSWKSIVQSSGLWGRSCPSETYISLMQHKENESCSLQYA